MRIAVITDIHGNLPALEAVLADIRARVVEHVICLGDCASGMGWPGETTALLMDRGIASVRGNHDRWVAEREPERMGKQDVHAHANTTPEQRAWLGSLARRLMPLPGVLACHGTPESDTQNLLEEPRHGMLVPSAIETVRERLGAEGLAARVVLCGHSHRSEVMQIPDGPLVVNPGSLGLPGFRITRGEQPHKSEARAPHARYAILHLPAEAPPHAELVVLPYDWETAARRAEALDAPVWAHVLRTGFLPA